MWLMTPRGFYSAVQKRDDSPTMLTIRARAEGDLENLLDLIPNLEITEGGGTDYPFRARCTAQEWSLALARMALEIDYHNFKDEVKKTSKNHADVYMGVWSKLLSLEPRRWRGKGFYGGGYGGLSDDRLFTTTPTATAKKTPKRKTTQPKRQSRPAGGKRGRGRQS